MAAIISIPENFLKSKGVKNPKLVIYGVTTLIAGIVIFVIVRAVIKSIQGPAKYSAGDMADALSRVKINGSNLSITNGEAILIANNLLEAMNRYGTDEQAIFAAMDHLQTKDDLLLVIKTFGIKLYDGFGLAVDWVSRNFISTPKNLQGWLRSELSGSDLKKVQDKFDQLGIPL
jgi:hypothetical protein